MMEISNRLRTARQRAGFDSAAAAARRFGWREPTYAAHENGSRGVRPDAAETYAKAFKVDPTWLLFGTGSPDRKCAAGFAEPDAAPFEPPRDKKDALAEIARMLAPQARTPSYYILGRDMRDLGLLTGDVLVVELNGGAAPGSLVLAQLVDDETGSAVTLLRRYVPPYLVGAAGTANDMLSTDSELISIMGVVVASFRPQKQ